MLVLTRKLGQRIELYHPSVGEITIDLLSISNKRIQLGLIAPSSVHISQATKQGANDEHDSNSRTNPNERSGKNVQGNQPFSFPAKITG